MYKKFYNFTDKPFNLTPNSKFFYSSEKHKEALNCLLLAIADRNGFVVITGEIGSGKTTVCRALLNMLDERTRAVLILNTYLNRKELLIAILDDLKIEYKSKTKTALLSALNRYLLEQAAAGTNVVLLIDEAQNLTPAVLEEVRMLSNLETEEDKLIQIVLMGQPELRKKLAHPRLEQFRQRVVLHYHLGPLTYEETREYVKHRLIKAGNAGADIFSPQAVEKIYEYSRGIPRLINLACHNALISGVVYETRLISGEIAAETVKELAAGWGESPIINHQ
ncbi:MAG: AAA family ATPase [Candidatus Omnitrophota bacterium]